MYVSKEYNPHTSTRYVNQNTDDAKKKKLPKLYESRENCCGCSACFAICPIAAITMEADEEGFLYPTVDAEKCVCCYRCLIVCAFKDNQRKKGYLRDNVVE